MTVLRAETASAGSEGCIQHWWLVNWTLRCPAFQLRTLFVQFYCRTWYYVCITLDISSTDKQYWTTYNTCSFFGRFVWCAHINYTGCRLLLIWVFCTYWFRNFITLLLWYMQMPGICCSYSQSCNAYSKLVLQWLSAVSSIPDNFQFVSHKSRRLSTCWFCKLYCRTICVDAWDVLSLQHSHAQYKLLSIKYRVVNCLYQWWYSSVTKHLFCFTIII